MDLDPDRNSGLTIWFVFLGTKHLAQFEIIDVGRIVEGFVCIEMSFLLNDKNHLFEVSLLRKFYFTKIIFSREMTTVFITLITAVMCRTTDKSIARCLKPDSFPNCP